MNWRKVQMPKEYVAVPEKCSACPFIERELSVRALALENYENSLKRATRAMDDTRTASDKILAGIMLEDGYTDEELTDLFAQSNELNRKQLAETMENADQTARDLTKNITDTIGECEGVLQASCDAPDGAVVEFTACGSRRMNEVARVKDRLDLTHNEPTSVSRRFDS